MMRDRTNDAVYLAALLADPPARPPTGKALAPDGERPIIDLDPPCVQPGGRLRRARWPLRGLMLRLAVWGLVGLALGCGRISAPPAAGPASKLGVPASAASEATEAALVDAVTEFTTDVRARVEPPPQS